MIMSRITAAVVALVIGLITGAWTGLSYSNSNKVTVCHATGSITNPYTMISVSADSLTDNSSDRGNHAGDFIPTPGATDCSNPPTSGGGTGGTPPPPTGGI